MDSKASAAIEHQAQLEQLAAQLRPIFEKHHVLRAIVFGPLARGETSRRSDVDLLVVQHTDKRFLERYNGLLRDLTQVVIGRDIDLLIYTPQELAQLTAIPYPPPSANTTTPCLGSSCRACGTRDRGTVAPAAHGGSRCPGPWGLWQDTPAWGSIPWEAMTMLLSGWCWGACPDEGSLDPRCLCNLTPPRLSVELPDTRSLSE